MNDVAGACDLPLTRSVLGSKPKGFAMQFVSLWQQPAKEKADTDLVRAQTDRQDLDIGAISEGGIARELHARGTCKTLTEKDVKLAEQLAATVR